MSRRVSHYFKDKEEELSFFRDLQKREKDQVASLLLPVSEEFEPNGNYELSRATKEELDGRRGSAGFDGFLGNTSTIAKNDYNWLKTPPATPLFPSLEMEANGQDLVLQREIPIIHHPLSRFAGHQEVIAKTSTKASKSLPINPKPKLPQRRETTPINSDKRSMKTAHVKITNNLPKKPNPAIPTPSKIIEPRPKPKVAASVRPTIILGTGFSDKDAPPNIRTAASAPHGSPSNTKNPPTLQKKDLDSKIRRQSCSPSAARGRKMDTGGNVGNQSAVAHTRVNACGSNGAQVLGSRMVERFMNARATNTSMERQPKMKIMNNENSRQETNNKVKLTSRSSLNENPGFIGRIMMTRSLH